jgi:hypothetical protein
MVTDNTLVEFTPCSKLEILKALDTYAGIHDECSVPHSEKLLAFAYRFRISVSYASRDVNWLNR